jgi:hypothetical protein
VRRRLADDLPPLGLHIGVVRIGTRTGQLVADVLIDASDLGHLDSPDSSTWWRAFGTIVYVKAYEPMLNALAEELPLGIVVSDAAL